MIQDMILQDIDLSRYVGQWVVVCENKVIAHNKDLTKIKNVINGCRKVPTIAKIPKKENLIF